mmetsp:Transcript_47953/g.124497  ORF Transcript_47953/g.124497 Transcript_47953/m.124497 type:complete len:207 (-) Transcript_47953:1159-1779(-)
MCDVVLWVDWRWVGVERVGHFDTFQLVYHCLSIRVDDRRVHDDLVHLRYVLEEGIEILPLHCAVAARAGPLSVDHCFIQIEHESGGCIEVLGDGTTSKEELLKVRQQLLFVRLEYKIMRKLPNLGHPLHRLHLFSFLFSDTRSLRNIGCHCTYISQREKRPSSKHDEKSAVCPLRYLFWCSLGSLRLVETSTSLLQQAITTHTLAG